MNYPKEFIEIREQILERDGYKCVICQFPDKNLHVHHADEDITNNSKNNLFTFCVRCHLYLHGRGVFPWWI